MDERRRKRSRRHGAAACAALVFALSALLVPAGAVSAPDPGGEAQLLVPVGKAIGVKLFAEGVLVVGLSENEGAVSPAKKGGMKAGDLILTMNDVKIRSPAFMPPFGGRPAPKVHDHSTCSAQSPCRPARAAAPLRPGPAHSRLPPARAGRRVQRPNAAAGSSTMHHAPFPSPFMPSISLSCSKRK